MPKTTPVPEEIRRSILSTKKAHPDWSGHKIAELFGYHQKTANRIINQGEGDKQPETRTSTQYPTLLETAQGELDKSAARQAPDFEDDELSGQWVQKEHYVFNGLSDTYVTVLKCRPKPLVISGNKFRSMKKAYSDWDGQPATINEICRRFAIPRDQFMELKSVHGWTHEAEPFTREEVMTRDVDEMADDAFQQRRQSVWEGFEKKKWHQTKIDAQKWNDLEQSLVQPLQDHLSSLVPAYTVPLINLKTARNPFAVVTSAGELHYGAAGWVMETGEEFNREEAADRLEITRIRMLEEVADRGRPEKFFYAVGHDFLAVDTDMGTTTKGTPQDTDGTAARILSEGLDLAVRDIDSLRGVSPIHILSVPGNHDRLLTLALLKFLQAWYKNDGDVTIEFSAKSRAYEAYGNTLLGFAHGDCALKPKDYVATMAVEAPELWSQTRYRAFFTGHLHHEVVRELVGGTHYQMPSLRGKDRYHERNSFLSDSALASYVVDKQHGVVSSIITKV